MDAVRIEREFQAHAATIQCIGYEDHDCDSVVQRISNNQKRCLDCAKEQRKRAAHKSQQVAYRTVYHHWYFVFKSQDENYKGMPFFDDWNPDKGGSFRAGAEWIIATIGKRPESATFN